eukprot:scaffold69595_cov15-Tisochrysis_lutea.AAC.1
MVEHLLKKAVSTLKGAPSCKHQASKGMLSCCTSALIYQALCIMQSVRGRSCCSPLQVAVSWLHTALPCLVSANCSGPTISHRCTEAKACGPLQKIQ